MFSGSVDAGLVLALLFHHRDLEPDCVGVSTRGTYKCRGGYARGGGGVFVGHYGNRN